MCRIVSSLVFLKQRAEVVALIQGRKVFVRTAVLIGFKISVMFDLGIVLPSQVIVCMHVMKQCRIPFESVVRLFAPLLYKCLK